MPRLSSSCKLLLVSALVVCGCPKRFDPRAEPMLTSPDSRANDEYQLARSALERRQNDDAASRFAQFIVQHPSDPLVDLARVGQARAFLATGKVNEAQALVRELALQPLPDNDLSRRIVLQKARLVDGLCAHRLNDLPRAEQRLTEIAEQIAPGNDANDLHAELADIYAGRGEGELAEREYARMLSSASPLEQAYLADRARAFCGQRPSCRERFTIVDNNAPPATSSTGKRAIGLVLPLSGKQRSLGERALRGALLASGLLDGNAIYGIEVADTRSDPKSVGAAASALMERAPSIVVGTPDKAEATLLVASSATANVPLLSLVAEDGSHASSVFHAIAGRSGAARALTERALAAGKRCVILAPDNNYGRTLSAVVAERWRQGGGEVVADLKYKESATTFVDPAKKMKALAPDVVIVTAPAQQLQLIAPQLVSTGVVAMANVPQTGKPAKLFAMADGLSPSILNGMAKYMQGATLAVLFYAAAEDAATQDFVRRYRAAFNEEPTLLDAITFDAVAAVVKVLDQGGADATTFATALGAVKFAGATGEVAFSPTGERVGKARLYAVRGGALKPVD